MIRIYDGGNQLSLTRELGANTNYEYYLYSSIKSVSWTKDVIGNYFLLINFITDDSDNPLKIKLLDTGSIASPVQYANTEAGAKLAVQDLHNWINSSFVLLGDLATEATLQQVEVNTSPYVRVPYLTRTTTSGLIVPSVYSFSVANVGTYDGLLLGSVIKSGEIINISAGDINNYFAANLISYDATGTEFIITYIATV